MAKQTHGNEKIKDNMYWNTLETFDIILSIGNIGYASFFGDILWLVYILYNNYFCVSLARVCVVYMVYIKLRGFHNCIHAWEFLAAIWLGYDLMQSSQLVYGELSRPLIIENVWTSLVYADLRQEGNVWGNCYWWNWALHKFVQTNQINLHSWM